MKTTDLALWKAAAILSVLLSSQLASAEPADTTQQISAPAPGTGTDPLFPQSGHVSVLLASGLPFLGITEVTYGVSNRFAVGLFAAATPDMPGVDGTLGLGVRLRGVLYAAGSWRAILVAPILYYPEVKGFGDREPWMLVRPTAMIERTFASGARAGVGAGVIGAACTDAIFSLGREHDMVGGIWETVNASFSIPIAEQTSVFAEASLILQGAAIARNWIGDTPVVAFTGITRSF